MDQSIDLKRITLVHVPPLTLFHLQNLGGKLTWLGASYVHYFYETALRQNDTVGWVALNKEEIVGFVFGSAKGGTGLGRMIRKNPLRWLVQALGSAAAHPRAFARVALSVMHRNASDSAVEHPELHYIAVRSDQRGHDIGKKLMLQFAKDLLARGGIRFDLSVLQDNQAAIHFYEMNGGQMTEDFETAGMKMRRFSFDLRRMLSNGG